MAGQAAGLKPSTFIEGGGLVGDVDVVFKETKFVLWDYNGKVPTPSPAIITKLVMEDGTEEEQYWSCGQAKDWVPSEDGKTLVAVGSATGLNVNSNAGMLITSVVNAGFPEDKLDNDITVFNGMKAHVIRQPVKREGMAERPARDDGRKFDPTVLVVSKIISLPWEAKGGGTTATSSGTAKSAGDGAGTLESKVQEAILEILMAEGKGVPKQQLVTKVYQAFKEHPEKNKIVQMVHRDEFLAAGPWKLAGGVVSMG